MKIDPCPLFSKEEFNAVKNSILSENLKINIVKELYGKKKLSTNSHLWTE